MLSLQDIDNIVLNGGTVVDAAGEKIGSVEQIFTSGDSGEPAFVTVRTGLFGMSESFAPLTGASLEESVIRVAFTKDTVKNGPRIESDRGAITETQEQELYSYYGLYQGEPGEGSTETGQEQASGAAGAAVPAEIAPGAAAAAPAAAEGRADDGGAPDVRKAPPPPRPHGGPPPPPPHLHRHVPPHLHPHPGPPPPPPGPRH
ncbi:PRC-barrel domain-containing protein [Pseudarthrobacter sp. H3Y2-7]|uniref:PRC-barrel domain-containing protein n=1 Tax=Pseudarthrobacter naphthalenicus TaxID=3031328 RepID=UPI0023B1C8FB|nr:PRC-barrel domain-containing protein [Pseudarthrobacter sp. H3Y2-7]MDE8668173.1 PRC-barrel domain-containing protein [Pseudarthrobacter sp. H3Y2-7]